MAREGPPDRPKPQSEHRHSSSSSSRPPHRPQPTKTFPPKPFEQRHPQASSSSSGHHCPTGPSGSSKPKSADLNGKLTKDGKLTQAEKQHRRDKNLCLWCGGPGHMANVCPLNTKARFASIPEASEAPKQAPDQGKE